MVKSEPTRQAQQIHAICKKATAEMERWIQVTKRSQPDFPQEKLEDSAHAHRTGFKAEELSGDQPNQALLFLAMISRRLSEAWISGLDCMLSFDFTSYHLYPL
jgi:hypothetical protein